MEMTINSGVKITKMDVSPVSQRVTYRREYRDMPDGSTKRFKIKTTTRFKTPRLAGNLEFEVTGTDMLSMGDVCEIKCGKSCAKAVVVNKSDGVFTLKSPSVMEYFSTEIGEPEWLTVAAHAFFESPNWGIAHSHKRDAPIRYEWRRLDGEIQAPQ